MSRLITEPNLVDPDGFYGELLGLHEGHENAESEALNARLILILANHIGDREVLREAFALAASTAGSLEDRGSAKPETF
jgi:hypothetical protein